MADAAAPKATPRPHGGAKNKLLRKVQAMNAAMEAENRKAREASEAHIAALKAQIQGCTEVLHRLRHERSSRDYQASLAKREALRRELAGAEHDAEPSTHMSALDAHMSASKAMHASQERLIKEEFALEIHREATRRSRDAAGHVKHATGWDGDTHAKEMLLRTPVWLGESDPSRLCLPWSRFDFVPSIPWHSAAAELERLPVVAGGLRDGSEVLEPAEARSLLASLRLPRGRARVTAAQAVAAGSQGHRSSPSLRASGSAVTFKSSTRSRGDVNAKPAASPPPPPRAVSLPRTGLTLTPHMLQALPPHLIGKPLHPAYLLPSRATHSAPWRDSDPLGSVFSVAPHEPPATDAEQRRGHKNTSPDRVHYNPAGDGKQQWRQPGPAPYPVFSTFALNDTYARELAAAEAAAREARFLQATAEDADEYGGEGGDAGEDEDERAHDFDA